MRSFFTLLILTFLSTRVHAEQLALDWKPEPEFGGFYEALKLKAYDKGGIHLTIQPGGAGQPVTQMVAGKKATFGIAEADQVILARAQGAKIVALFAVYQNSPEGFMVHPGRHFKSLKDMFQSSGTIAMERGLPYTLWLEKMYQPFQAKIVPYTGGVASFIQDAQFSQQCFVTSEPLAAKREKVDSKTFLISESGFNPYTAVVIVHEDTLKDNPSMVKAFVDASRMGWQGYLAHPENTNKMMQKLNSAMDLATFNEVALVQRPFIETAETKKSGLGSMSLERWKTLNDQLVELKLVKAGMDPSTFFTQK